MITLNAQKQIVPDSRLIEWLGADEVQLMLEKAPDKILIYNYMLTSSYYISKGISKNIEVVGNIYDVKTLRGSEFFNIDERKVLDKDFNYLKYDFKRDPQKNTAYKIGSTEYFLIIYSGLIYYKKEKEYIRSFGIKY